MNPIGCELVIILAISSNPMKKNCRITRRQALKQGALVAGSLPFIGGQILSAKGKPIDKLPFASGKPTVFEIHDFRKDPMAAPMVEPWATVDLNQDYGGAWVVAADVDGDGEIEIITARQVSWWTGPHLQGGISTHFTASVAVQKLDGSLLWHWGSAGQGERITRNDVACQVYDWNGDGKLEIVVIGRSEMAILDAASGNLLRAYPVPPFACDCVIAADLVGRGYPSDFIIKDRYFQMWGMRSDGKILWESPRTSLVSGPWHLGHHPLPIDMDGDGKDEIFAGFFMLDHDGKVLWELNDSEHVSTEGVHMDGKAVIQRGDNPEDWLFAFTYCNGLGIGLIDGRGRLQKEIIGSHFESLKQGPIFPAVAGQQLAVDIDHGPPFAIEIFDENLTLLGRINLDYGRFFSLVDWDGDGCWEVANAHNGGIYNHRGEKLATLDLGGDVGLFAIQTGDFTGNQGHDLLVMGARMDKVRIFENPSRVRHEGIPFGTGPNFTNY